MPTRPLTWLNPARPEQPETITDRAELERVLEQIRDQGYATSFGEWESDVVGIAAPVRDAGGEAGPVVRADLGEYADEARR